MNKPAEKGIQRETKMKAALVKYGGSCGVDIWFPTFSSEIVWASSERLS